MCAAALLALVSGASAQGIFDAGTTAPVAGLPGSGNYDISQTNFLVNVGPAGLNYYTDNGTPPGQTFTTGTNAPTASGYKLASLYVKNDSGGGGNQGLDPYSLRIYSVSGTAVTLLTTYTSTNSLTVISGRWIQWTGLTNVLNTNTVYAFSLRNNNGRFWRLANTSANPYSGGQCALFPQTSGTLNFGSGSLSDAAFLIGLISPEFPSVSQPVISPTNSPIYAGTVVTLSATAAGNATLQYNWQTDGGTGGASWTDLPSSNTNSYVLDTTGMSPVTNLYQVIVTNSLGSVTSSVARLVVTNASGPIIVANTTITPPSVAVGGTAVASASYAGTLPIYYQWQFNNVNIPGATANVFTVTNVQFANAGSYSLVASNNPGGVPTSLTNTPATLVVRPPVVLADFGTTDPVVGANDIAQLSTDGNVGNPGVGYYTDNTPGQTFTTGSNPSGYALSSLYIKYRTLADGSHTAGNPWTLRLYSLTNSALGNAVLIGTYTNDNTAPAISTARWLKWYGPITNMLSPNTAYAYMVRARGATAGGAGFLQVGNASNSPSFYSGGRLVSIAAAGGAMGLGNAGTANFDATFMVNMVPAGYPSVQDVSMTPTNGSTIFAGAPVTLNVTAIGDNIGYIWQTDNGTGGASFSDLPSSNTNRYSLNTSGLTTGTTYQLRVLVTNSFDTNVSSTVTLTVVAAVIQTVSIAPVNNSSNNPVYAGTPVTLSATVQGNNLTYYWQTDGGLGGGFTDIPSSNTNIFGINTSAMSAGTYLYQLVVSNASGTVTSSQLTLNLAAASGPVLLTGTTINPTVVIVGNNAQMNATFTGSQPITYQWQHAGTNMPGATATSYTLTAAQLTDAGNWSLQASNSPPGIGPTTGNSTAAFLYVVAPPQTNTANAIIADGGTSPFVGQYDVYQLANEDGTIPFKLNYYVDATPAPGQTFTTSNAPPTAAGYPLNYVYVKHDATGNGTGFSTAQSYTLRVYQILDGTNAAALLTSYITTNSFAFPAGDWVRIGGLTNMLKTNTVYAFALSETTPVSFWKLAAHVSAGDDYAEGMAVSLPALGGQARLSYPDTNFGFYYDAAFVAGMTPPTIPVVLVDTTITPSACLVGQPVTMQATFNGLQPIAYKWQHEGTNIPSATNSTYTIAAAQFDDAGSYVLTATNSLGGAVSSPVNLTVNPYPQSFVINYAFTYGSVPATLYNGLGVIGGGTYWNQINVGGTNVNSYADDGATALNIKFNSTVPNQFNNSGAGDIGLLRYYMYGGNGAATPYTFSLTNLTSGVYNLVLFSCNGGNFHDSGTGFSVNGQTNVATCSTSSSFVNNNNYVVFYNIAVTNGTINASWWKTGGREAAFNGAQLQMAFSYANPLLVIAQQPASRTNLTGTVASFSVLAEAPGSLFYQWRSNSVPISGATNSSYSAYTGTPGVWSYDVIVSTNLSLGSSVTSDTATLTVVEPNHLVWRGYTADWDLVSGNWSNLVTLADNVVFGATDAVLFNDSAASFTASITGALTPSSVTVNDTVNDYIFNGTGSLSGSMGLTKTANGTLTISNNNTYTGGTTVNGGTLALAKGGAAGTVSGNLTINAAGTVNLLAADALGYAGNFVTTANIVGGTLNNVVGGNNAFATSFNLTGGTMSSSGGGAYNFDGAGGASVNSLASSTVSTISGPVALRSSPLVISTAQGSVPSGIDLNISGAIGGGGNDLTKTGAGTLALSGVNTYSGLTTISNGRLLVNGTVPGVVTVNSGATLGGTGTIGGQVTIQAGGTLVAGASIGTLTLNSSPVLGGAVVAEINRNGGSPLADLIVVVGNPLTYGGSLVVSNLGAA